MGGVGSGTGFRFNRVRTKAFAEEYKAINARMFVYQHMKNLPPEGINFELQGVNALIKPDRIEIPQGTWKLYIPFLKHQPNYGNFRYFLECPNPKCQRRCLKLYLQRWNDGTNLFLCRKCLRLAYRSQNTSRIDRMIDRKWAILHRLGADSSALPDKPKLMHRKTYHRLCQQVEELEIAINSFGLAKFGKLPGFKGSIMESFFE